MGLRHVLAEMGEDEVAGRSALLGVGVLALGGDQALDEAGVRLVLAELVFQPGGQVFLVLTAAEHAGTAEQPVRPQIGPVAGIFVAVQQPVDELGAARFLGIFEELADFLGLGDAADNVQRGAADELVIVGVARRDDLVLLPLLLAHLVDDRDHLGQLRLVLLIVFFA